MDIPYLKHKFIFKLTNRSKSDLRKFCTQSSDRLNPQDVCTLVTCINVAPFMAFDTTHISDLNTKRLISNLTVSFAVAFSRSVVLPLPFKFVFGFIIFLLSFFFCSRRWFVHKVHTEFVLAFFAQQCSKWKIFVSETYLWYWNNKLVLLLLRKTYLLLWRSCSFSYCTLSSSCFFL